MPDYDQLKDYQFFKSKRSALMQEHKGDFAVIHNCEIRQFFGNESNAIQFAEKEFGSGRYIVQEVHQRRPRPMSYTLLTLQPC